MTEEQPFICIEWHSIHIGNFDWSQPNYMYEWHSINKVSEEQPIQYEGQKNILFIEEQPYIYVWGTFNK